MDVKYLQKLQRSKKLQDLEWGMCVKDPYYFMTHWAYTLDSHDPENPKKVFPDKEYIKILVNLWMTKPLMLVPKSRQMMMSWIFVCLYLWDTQFHYGRLNFFQSKKSEDADQLVRRAKFIYDHEPKFLKRYYEGGQFKDLICNPQHGGQHTQGKLTFPQIYSEIRGIPEGGDIIRSYTASGIFEDEMAFQPESSAAYTAAKPTLSSMGKFTGVSTAEDNTFFDDMVYDLVEV